MIQEQTILKALPQVLKTIDIAQLGQKYQGKVRDFYKFVDKRILITTDRQSAFDVILGHIPFKGSVLNLLSAFWFAKTKHIVPNHLISVPHPNVLIAKDCQPIPVEMVVRGYISGVTKTSIWYSYEHGDRLIYGIKFPEGLKKNQKLTIPVITPTSHGGGKSGHDERLTREQIIARKIVPEKLYKQMEKAALTLFDYGSKLCKKRGLILVDTKYEFGLYKGKLTLIDEIHTPDSSRFWIVKTYAQRFAKGAEPENFDKEFLRLWYNQKGYLGDGPPPPMSKELVVQTAQRYIGVYEKITGRKFKTYPYPIQKNIQDALNSGGVKLTYSSGVQNQTIRYADVGDNYDTKDPIKKLAQTAAASTGKNLKSHGFSEITDSRGESAYVWSFDLAQDKKPVLMASVIEGLGTKNLVADGMGETTGKTYYDVIAHDTVATIINDLVSVGATPLVLHAYWAIEDNSWLENKTRMIDFINGWKNACDIAGVSWGGGETPTLKGIVTPGTIDLGGSAIGIIKNKQHLITDTKLKSGDRIVLLKSNGVNANGISLTRAIAKKLPQGFKTKLPNGKMYGEALLTKTHVYAKLIAALQKADIDIHYISNITGHGLRKLMRPRPEFTYVIEKIWEPQPVFAFIQKQANLSDYEMYQTYNMGNDYALYLTASEVKKALGIIKRLGFAALDAGYVEKGERQVKIVPKNIVFSGSTLDLR